MKDILAKADKRKALLVGIPVLLVLIAGAWFFTRRGAAGGSSGDVAYVTSVAELTGTYASNGVFNRFGGIVEPQATKAFNKRDDAEIDEIYVQTGDAVKVGTPLFSYDNAKYEEDLAKAEIELERMYNEKDSIEDTIEQLQREQRSAPSSQKAGYTVQIQEQQLNYRQQDYDIQSKELEIEKLKDNIAHATVTSDMEGVVKSINKDGGSQPGYGDESDSGVIVVMKTGDFRVKGTVNEQNIYDVSEGLPVIVHSRLDEKVTWRGTITSIDRENTDSNNNNMYGEGPGSSSYPFYVDLESSEGLLIGQHVYLEIDYGQGSAREGIWLDEYMIDMTDPNAPFVWAEDSRGRLEKRKIKFGEFDGELMQYQVREGLSAEDRIAFPDESLREGMTCVSAEMMPFDEPTEGMDGMEPGEDMEEWSEPGDEMDGLEPMEGMDGPDPGEIVEDKPDEGY